MTRKSVVLIIVSTLTLLVLITVGGVWAIFHFVLSGRIFGYTPPETPAQLKEPRVVIGNQFLRSTKLLELGFAANVSVGEINDIAFRNCDGKQGEEIVSVGGQGALILSPSGEKQKLIRFQIPVNKDNPFGIETPTIGLGSFQVIDLESDGKCEFLGRGGTGGAAIFDLDGKLLWHYGEYKRGTDVFLRDATVGDLDGDGVAELVTSRNGIQVFDKSGKLLNKVDEEFGVLQIEVLDTDEDGNNEIVSLAGSLVIRNAEGEVIRTHEVDGYFGNFTVLETPDKKQLNLLSVENGVLVFFNVKGEVVKRIDLPLSEFDDTVSKYPGGEESRGTSVYEAEGVWIKLSKDQPEFLALITNFAAIDRSVLDVFDATGKLIYQEVLPESCSSIAKLPSTDPAHPDQLLVGGESTIWKYQMQ